MKVNEWPWPLIFIQVHVPIKLTASTNFDIIDYNSFWNIHYFTFFPYKSIRNQIWSCRKTGQGQFRVIIWANLVALEHPMLHTKFQGHWLIGCREEDFKVFTIYGHGGHLGHMNRNIWATFVPPSHRSSIWNLTLILRRCLKSVADDDDGRRRTTDDRGLPIL